MNREYGSLTAADVTTQLTADSVLCLPFGSHEQHGPHLPLHTDTVIAEGFTRRLVERYGLWSLPALPFGLSLEHAWSPGTLSLGVRVATELLDALIGEVVRATPVRRLLVVNGHGGNRGLLEALVYEWERTHNVRVCVVHPNTLSTVVSRSVVPEVHAGTRETSVMLALAPDDVHLDRLGEHPVADQAWRDRVRSRILDRGTTWPWSSGDPDLAASGITGGDPRLATAEIGESIINSALDGCAAVLDAL